MVGLRESKEPLRSERTNEVRRFMIEQMSLPPLATKQLRAKARRRRRSLKQNNLTRRGEYDATRGLVVREGEEEMLLVDETPRCLREKDHKASPQELKSELQQAIEVMQSYSSAIKDDVLSIKKICPITNPRAKRFLKQWAAEKLGRILEDLMFSVVLVSWERWKQRVQLEKKMERITAYMKFQSSLRIKRVFETWAVRHLAGAWMNWKKVVLFYKKVERVALEVKNVKILQRVYRGHRGRQRVAAIRRQKRAVYERKAAVRMQAFVRGCMTRKKLVEILKHKAEKEAAILIQAIARAK